RWNPPETSSACGPKAARWTCMAGSTRCCGGPSRSRMSGFPMGIEAKRFQSRWNSDKTASAHGLPEDSLLPRDTRRSLPLMMLRARDVVMARFRPFLMQHDLSEQQWRVLRVLGEVDQMDSREVAERACLMAPSLTRIVRALETRRLIVKRRHPDDARRIFLSIT